MATKWQTPFDYMCGLKNHDIARRFAESGDQFYVDYTGSVDAAGNIVLKERGKVNLYEQIQSHKQSCDINFIVAKYRAGDPDALNQVHAMYADVTKMPDNIHDAFELIKDAQEVFETAPVEVREEYDHNFAKFLAAATTNEFITKWKDFGKAEPSPEISGESEKVGDSE